MAVAAAMCLSVHIAPREGSYSEIAILYRCSLEQVVLERYSRLGEQVAACYAGTPLRPSPGELQQLFRQVTPPWT